jgi:hypothetical protein
MVPPHFYFATYNVIFFYQSLSFRAFQKSINVISFFPIQGTFLAFYFPSNPLSLQIARLNQGGPLFFVAQQNIYSRVHKKLMRERVLYII